MYVRRTPRNKNVLYSYISAPWEMLPGGGKFKHHQFTRVGLLLTLKSFTFFFFFVVVCLPDCTRVFLSTSVPPSPSPDLPLFHPKNLNSSLSALISIFPLPLLFLVPPIPFLNPVALIRRSPNTFRYLPLSTDSHNTSPYQTLEVSSKQDRIAGLCNGPEAVAASPIVILMWLKRRYGR